MKSIIIGAGTYGQVYLTYLREAGVEIVGFLDDAPNLHGARVNGVPVLGRISDLEAVKNAYGPEAVYCPLGNNRLRVKFLQQARDLGLATPNFIHPSVLISPDVTIATEAVYILPGTIVMPHVVIHPDVMISVGANIIHHSELCRGVFISNGVNFGASIVAHECAYVGMGSTVMTGVGHLGADCLIGAGAVVIRDVPPGAVMAGVPAKIIKFKPEYPQNQ